MEKRLYRSRRNRVLGGVCGGLGEYLDIDPTIVRLLTALLVVFAGLSVWIYIIALFIMPNEPDFY